MELALKRRGGDGADLDDGDFDGGTTGNSNDLLRPFHGKSKVVKTFVITRDENSVVSRLGRIAGVGNANLTESLHLASTQQVACKPREYKRFSGSTAGSVIGLVSMSAWHPDACWHETYGAKKDIFTSAHLIPVCGQADDPTGQIHRGAGVLPCLHPSTRRSSTALG